MKGFSYKRTGLTMGVFTCVAIGIFVALSSANISPKNAYSNEIYGISFSYPQGYVLTEGERGNAQREHYSIVLIREEDSAPRENSDGPTAITIDIYQNNLDKQTLVGWLNGGNLSNYKLGNGTFIPTTVDGSDAVNYKWSGLYEGETTAFLHTDNIIAVTVTSITPQDLNRQTYRDLIQSIKLMVIR